MGIILVRAKTFCRKLSSKQSAKEKQLEYDLGIDGFPSTLKASFNVEELLVDGAQSKLYSIGDRLGRRLVLKAYTKERRSYQYLDFHTHALAIAELRACQLRHEHICTYVGFFESRDLFCAVSERCDGGSIQRFLQDKLRFEDESHAANIFTQALSAVSYLHSKDIVHRDLRLEQFLFTSRRRAKVKLSDIMHAAKPTIPGGKVVDASKPQILLFAAPESIANGEYTTSSDSWQMGCCLYEMIYGHPPYTGQGKALAKRIVQDEVEWQPMWSDASKQVVNLLRSLLMHNSRERMLARKARGHVWFRAAVKLSVKQRQARQLRQKLLPKVVEATKSALPLQHGDSDEEDDNQSPRSPKQRTTRHGVVLEEDMDEFAESLTRTYSHLSDSTLSGDELAKDQDMAFDENEKAHSEEGLAVDTVGGEEDWQSEAGRSDLASRTSEISGDADSNSDTYVNSEQGMYARTKGFWDEFDSEFFDEDREASSCWSEAEWSDWTINEELHKSLDRDFDTWLHPGKKADSKRKRKTQRAAEEEAAMGAPISAAAGAEEEAAQGTPSTAAAGAEDGGTLPAPSSRASENTRPEGKPGEHGQESQRGLIEGRQEPKAAESSSSASASDELERAARDRSDPGSNSAAASRRSGGSQSSAPWDYVEPPSDAAAGSTMSGPRAGPRPSPALAHGGGSHSQRQQPSGSRADKLTSIKEDRASDGPSSHARESIGEVTRRSLVEQGVAAPWDRQEASQPPRAAGSAGMIILSRRSSNSSSSGKS